MACNLRTGMVLLLASVAPAVEMRGQGCCPPEAHGTSSAARPVQPLATPNSGVAASGTLGEPPSRRERQPPPPPHGGQISETQWHHFEVVYLPHETRIYVYSLSRVPLYPQGAQGEVTMRMISNDSQFQGPVRYATDENGRGYLSLEVDVSRVRDGDMTVEFVLQRLPFRQEPEAVFSQTFARTRPIGVVRQVPLTQDDHPLLMRQQNCPVSQTPLGLHGAPIKLLVGDTPLLVCGSACIGQVEKNAHIYVAGGQRWQ